MGARSKFVDGKSTEDHRPPDLPSSALADTMMRVIRAASLPQRRRWLGSRATVMRSCREGNWRDVVDEFEIERVAWVFGQLSAVDDRGTSDKKLLRWAVSIDDRALRCRNYNRPTNWGFNGAARGAEAEGLASQLRSLLERIEFASTPASLHQAWFDASPHVREIVLLAPEDVYWRLQLQRAPLLSAIRSAIGSLGRGRPPLRPRPVGLRRRTAWAHEEVLAKLLRDIVVAISLRPLYRTVTDSDAGGSLRPGDSEGVLIDLARNVSRRYQLPRPLIGRNSIHRLKQGRRRPRKQGPSAA